MPADIVPTPLPPITFPEALPVSARRDEIAQALRAHPVIIVCGETGSGKTTQLPKIALALGRGRANSGKLIGHTQPRRIAASSVAKRIAEELNTPLGAVVGFKVRFQDRLQPGASVKLMTDGILLAETQSDPLLRAYDTLIIDEAHERSLNIDFLLGHLKQILPRRPDLKVIVTSATIDADRFAQHFAGAHGPAPVIQVSGRLFPVEQRWRPFEETRERDLNVAIADAVDELWRAAPAATSSSSCPASARSARPPTTCASTSRTTRRSAHSEILPLFARLSQAEQDRVFETGRRAAHRARDQCRRNLAHGARHPLRRSTPASRASSATATATRSSNCRSRPSARRRPTSAPGAAAAWPAASASGSTTKPSSQGRPRFTDPEILRSSLAGVILRMKSLGLGLVEDFPFLEPPPKKAIADGYALLGELGAVDERNELTAIGRELSRLPLDPRIGRMIVEARERQSLTEVLVIAAALSGQDVRDRPQDRAAGGRREGTSPSTTSAASSAAR